MSEMKLQRSKSYLCWPMLNFLMQHLLTLRPEPDDHVVVILTDEAHSGVLVEEGKGGENTLVFLRWLLP